MSAFAAATFTDAHPAGRRALRKALGAYATGVAVVTARAGQRLVGMTVNSFNSVSLDPPLVLWSVARTAPSAEAFAGAGHFAVNVLGHAQEHLAHQFARSAADKFDGVAWTEGLGGAALVEGAVAAFECARHAVYDGGDHLIVLGRVERFASAPAAPLVFHGGAFTTTRA